jgi:hypothetical protein
MGDTGASGVVGFFVIVAIFACTAILGALFLFAITRNFGKASTAIAFVTGILLIPFLFISAPIAYQLLKDARERSIADAKSRSIAFAYMRDDLNSLIDRFYAENPRSFTFLNDKDEAASSPDLLHYLAGNDVFLRSGFSIKDGSLLSPFSDPVLLAIDKNHDGLIVTINYVCASPWTDGRYSCALIRHTTRAEAKQTHADWKRQN